MPSHLDHQVFTKIEKAITDTTWWLAYRSQLKGCLMSHLQKNRAVDICCIEGGAVTRVESSKMEHLKTQVLDDLEKRLGTKQAVRRGVRIRNFLTFDDFEKAVNERKKPEAGKGKGKRHSVELDGEGGFSQKRASAVAQPTTGNQNHVEIIM